MSNYENAPATKMLNTHCVCCHRPLVDAVSVECGVGPICREKYGYEEIGAERRDEANDIIHQCARKDATDEDRKWAYLTLKEMGFHKIASAILHVGKAPVVKLRESSRGTGYYVTAPYSASALNAWRTIPGRRWATESKENFVPHSSMEALNALIEAHYPGAEVQKVSAEVQLAAA